jgi:phenylpropionate dioxygenase-like ring-hydroxylating dioxygenase large terminal subunit
MSMNHVKNFDKKDYGLLPARLEEWGGMLFINLDGRAPPLKQYLGDIVDDLAEYPLDDLIPARSKTYEVNANWKLMVENYLEYYHLPAVHPALCNVSGVRLPCSAPPAAAHVCVSAHAQVDEHVEYQGTGMYGAFATMPLTKGGTAVDPDVLPPFPGITPLQANSALHYCIFPNVFFSVYPHHTFRVIVQPHPTDPGNLAGAALCFPHTEASPPRQPNASSTPTCCCTPPW